jgi:hypothetical protein
VNNFDCFEKLSHGRVYLQLPFRRLEFESEYDFVAICPVADHLVKPTADGTCAGGGADVGFPPAL